MKNNKKLIWHAILAKIETQKFYTKCREAYSNHVEVSCFQAGCLQVYFNYESNAKNTKVYYNATYAEEHNITEMIVNALKRPPAEEYFKGVTLPGAATRILIYLTPDWKQLANTQVWDDAAVQTFFALSPAWIVAVCNIGTSFFVGLVIFSIIGFLVHELDVEVEKIVDQGAVYRQCHGSHLASSGAVLFRSARPTFTINLKKEKKKIFVLGLHHVESKPRALRWAPFSIYSGQRLKKINVRINRNLRRFVNSLGFKFSESQILGSFTLVKFKLGDFDLLEL
uniref:Uncharacterized protein n=1 Tax=Glossina austeni TaxID=7395 RepID=A0A1A9UEU1_GLOAU